MRKANIVFLGVAALVAGFFAAAVVMMQSGDCWQNCDPETTTVYSDTPFLVYFGAVAVGWTSFCVFLWTRHFRPSAATWLARLTSGAVAGVATVPLAAVLARVL